MKQLVFFLEEPSAKAMLEGLLPKLLSDRNVVPRYVTFEGKQDMEKQLPRKLRGWKALDASFVVLRDKDSGNCKDIKAGLVNICRDAGKPEALVRIVCHELESWYLGDLSAVEKGLQIPGAAKKQNTKKFREPDRLANPAQELRKLTGNKYQKVAGSRRIGPCLSLDNNRSVSFGFFISGVRKIIPCTSEPLSTIMPPTTTRDRLI
ncbi:MAG: DUF4276 family protein [Gammaproteobacteria bacterium]|nr:DUF4276 family protein [Gammaproteobacteria bacterium]NNJ84930.1 DUF4276 family protein [Gammaproteobacteria bacterium]